MRIPIGILGSRCGFQSCLKVGQCLVHSVQLFTIRRQTIDILIRCFRSGIDRYITSVAIPDLVRKLFDFCLNIGDSLCSVVINLHDGLGSIHIALDFSLKSFYFSLLRIFVIGTSPFIKAFLYIRKECIYLLLQVLLIGIFIDVAHRHVAILQGMHFCLGLIERSRLNIQRSGQFHFSLIVRQRLVFFFNDGIQALCHRFLSLLVCTAFLGISIQRILLVLIYNLGFDCFKIGFGFFQIGLILFGNHRIFFQFRKQCPWTLAVCPFGNQSLVYIVIILDAVCIEFTHLVCFLVQTVQSVRVSLISLFCGLMVLIRSVFPLHSYNAQVHFVKCIVSLSTHRLIQAREILRVYRYFHEGLQLFVIMSLSRVDFPQYFVISLVVSLDIHQLIGEFFYSFRCLFGKFIVACRRTFSNSSTISIVTIYFYKESIDEFLCCIIFALGQHLSIVLDTLLAVYPLSIVQTADICFPGILQGFVLFIPSNLRGIISSPVGQMRLDIRIKCLDL